MPHNIFLHIYIKSSTFSSNFTLHNGRTKAYFLLAFSNKSKYMGDVAKLLLPCNFLFKMREFGKHFFRGPAKTRPVKARFHDCANKDIILHRRRML